MDYYKEEISSIYKELDSSEKGLSNGEAKSRISKFGYNELKTDDHINKFKLFISQFKSFIIYILFFAVILSVAVGEYVDAIIILLILTANALIGYFQELSAQKSLNALKKLNTIHAKVLRDGNIIELDSKHLVPGDIIKLEAGDKVPADCRIIECARLKVEEAALTGESVPVDKNIEKISKEVQIGDRKNMLFSSTAISEGTALAIVCKTAMKTEIGKITKMISENEEKATPLQVKLDAFGKKLGYAVIAICLIIVLVFGLKVYFGGEAIEDPHGHNNNLYLTIFLIAVALAVAAVPEGLPAVVTITLSIGVKKLLKKKALVRKLSSVETLGSCNVICSDKTGTLTKNQMTVEKAWTLDNEVNIEGVGYNPQGNINGKINPLLFEIGCNCNNASLYKKDNIWQISGDPTEAALIVSSKKASVNCNTKKLDELPFDSSRKLMSTLVERDRKLFTYTKGAPDQILGVCTHVIHKGKAVKLTSELKKEIHKQIDEYSKEALRVLAFAYKPITNKKNFTEKELIFVGLQAMIDPPRPDVIESIKKTKEAGIRVIMITGDYKETAKAIANEIGINGNVLTGQDLEKMSDHDLRKALNNNTNIFARVIPEHKMRIVAELQKEGNIVAMTGDGVNDAPALDKADIGVAVGSGTDVAKEAADFVLLDDSFTNIVNAIEEGRGIYDNIQKTIMHLLSGNLSEVLIIFFAVLLGWNLPLTAIMLLWINLITDGAPALALAVDPYSDSIMKRKPKIKREGILPKPKLMLITFLGIVATIIGLAIFKYFDSNYGLIIAQTMTFNFIVLSELILVMIIRQQYHIKQFTNKWIWYSFLGSITLQAIILYTPLNEVFGVSPKGLYEIGFLIGGGIILYVSYLIYNKIYQDKELSIA